ncbi:hypothetical protein BDV37DRAFT_205403 [Aspergillus pseudonomiae]|uniref:Uncharacterized protein n=1 Tax=Aspergillus pseudonomiae TaxID=1506151 RepID=A0A5N7DNP0_9EURO|nr:uncharacterized protein BDV37DRAFT_205403 [Aspergillus pseudonomiae]KAE8407935.1 hypothetical protein BDV37DRAFT_205403 [Aspergillus pseudonomiae]
MDHTATGRTFTSVYLFRSLLYGELRYMQQASSRRSKTRKRKYHESSNVSGGRQKRKGHAMSIKRKAYNSPSFKTSRRCMHYMDCRWIPREACLLPGEPMISNYIRSPKLGPIAQHQLKLLQQDMSSSSAKSIFCYRQAKKLTFRFTHSPTLNFPLQSTSQRPESRTIHSRGFESFLADRVRERLTKQKSKREKRGGEKRGGKKVKPGKGCAGMPIHNQHQSSSGGGRCIERKAESECVRLLLLIVILEKLKELTS